LGSPRDDSRYREMENVEAHPMVPSARWGTQWSGGAMEELTGAGDGVSPLLVALQRKR
jgi:hypothetical protein